MKDEQKVFIRGVEGRGDEVIKMLEEHGGKNCHVDGADSECLYFIDHEGLVSLAIIDSEFGKIIMDNYKEIKLPEKWKDGDLLEHTDDDGSTDYAVYKETEEFNEYTQPYCILTYVCVNRHIYGINTILNKDNWKLASDEEHKKFYELLHKHGVDWDAEKKKLVDWKWKPKENETYWSIWSDGHLSSGVFKNDQYDKGAYNFGNCFRTREEAEIAAERVKKALKGGDA